MILLHILLILEHDAKSITHAVGVILKNNNFGGGQEKRSYAAWSTLCGATFEQELEQLCIRHILVRARHLQTNCKLERFCGTIEKKWDWFDGIDAIMRWYNDHPHISLD